jgi:signal transduction histidine kinase
MVRGISLLLFLLSLGEGASAWGRPVWRFRTFTTRDGLAHNIVRDVLETREGTLWLATMGGLTRYDPRSCRYQTLGFPGKSARQEVMALGQSKDGALWVATQGGGVGRMAAGRWTWFTTRDGVPSDEISSLLVDRSGHIWVTPTTGGVARFDGRRWQAFTAKDGLSEGEIGRCAELRSGDILCGTYDRPLLQRFAGNRWSQVEVDAPLGRHFYVHAVMESRSGDLWLATKGTGAIRGKPVGPGYDWTVYDSGRGLASNRVGAMREASDGAIWFGTSDGVSRFDGERWQTLSRKDGLGSNQVFAITETRDRALWFATLGGGVSRYAASGWEHIGEEDGLLSDNVTGGLLRVDRETLWVGTDLGISTRRGTVWAHLRTGRVARDHVNHLLRDARGAIWVATRDGVRRFAGGAWLDAPATPGADGGPVHPVVQRLARGPRDQIWAATAGGVSTTLDGVKWRSYTRSHGLPADAVNDVLVDSGGSVWAATDSGVARLGGERFVPFVSSGPSSRADRVHGLALDAGGQIWAAGLEGVDRFDGSTWHRVPPNPWLPGGLYSRFVMATAEGSLWFAVRGLGVRRLRGGQWTAYSTEDGLAADTVSDVQLTDDGSFLFATLGGGLSLYRPDRNPPETHLGTSPDGRPSGTPVSVVQGEDLALTFGGQDVLQETETRSLLFSYRLDGGSWSAFSASTRAVLVGLRPGEHIFEVRAMDQDLNVDPTPARHRFRVVRRWWTEPWLFAVVVLTLLLAGYAAIRLGRAVARERAAVAREQAAVSQRRHFVRLAAHELRRPLSRLAHRAEMLLEPSALDDPEKLRLYASAIAADSTDLARMVDTLLDQARLQEGLKLSLEQGDLRAVVQGIVREFRGDSPDESRLVLDTADQPLPVAYDPFYLPLAIRNLLDNAIKYGGEEGRIDVRTRAEGDQACLRVEDSGPGVPLEEHERVFEPFYRGQSRPSVAHAGFGLGLSFARDIARAHGGDLVIEPATKGAAFRLRIPLHRQPG